MCESVGKADLLSDHFDSKQSREFVDLPVTCHPCGVRRLLRLGSFPACWRQANVTPIPKGPSSSSVANYRPDRKSTRLNSSHSAKSRMPSSA